MGCNTSGCKIKVDSAEVRKSLPIPIQSNSGNVYDAASIVRPKPKILADANKIAKTGDQYTALLIIMNGSVVALYGDDDITDSGQIKALLRKMPFVTFNYLMVEVLMLNDLDDGVQGSYPCPICNQPVLAQYIPSEVDGEEPQLDTRDFIGDLKVSFMTDYVESFTIELTKEVSITNADTQEVLTSVSMIEMVWPTIGMCINAYHRLGLGDEMRLQMNIYAQAVKSVNGGIVDDRWSRLYGQMIFENIHYPVKDFGSISKKLNEWGRSTKIRKHCPSCQHDFSAHINTSNFFDFALQL